MNAEATTPDLLPIGCIFDGAHGYEANAGRVIDLAKAYGWVDAEEGLGRVDHLEEIEGWEDGEHLTLAEQDATEYLADFAPDGHWVGWHEGDFGVYPDEEEDEDNDHESEPSDPFAGTAWS